jgi:lysyl-tRNA synthetase, class II
MNLPKISATKAWTARTNPEFTVLEIYVAYKDYLWMMDFTEAMLERVVKEVTGGSKVTVNGTEIDFQRPFKRISILDAIKEHTGFDVAGMSEAELREVCTKTWA